MKARTAVTRITIAILIVALAVGAGIANTVLAGRNDQRSYSPDSLEKDGVAALAAVLEQSGVQLVHVQKAADLAPSAETTVVLTQPDYLSETDAKKVRDSGATVILLGSAYWWDPEIWGFSVNAWTSEAYSEDMLVEDALVREDSCPLLGLVEDDADGSTVAPVSQILYDDESLPSERCFAFDDGYGWARSASYPNVEYYGAGLSLTNEFLDQYSNAGVALRLLSRHSTVLWLEGYASEEFVGEGDISYGSLPQWFTLSVAALLLSGLWFAAYKARRFGKLVAEPMPVVVPAEEANEGRARLYQANSAAAHSANVLRAAFISRYASRLGIAPGASPDAVTRAFTAATGQPARAVSDALYTHPVNTDSDLAHVAAALSSLEKEFNNARA